MSGGRCGRPNTNLAAFHHKESPGPFFAHGMTLSKSLLFCGPQFPPLHNEEVGLDGLRSFLAL